MKTMNSYNEIIKRAVMAKFGMLYSGMTTKREKQKCTKFIREFRLNHPKSQFCA